MLCRHHIKPMQQILKVVCVLLLSASTLSTWAQRVVTGSVVDENNQPLIGAAVTTKEDKTLGTVTDIDGNYKLTLPQSGQYTLSVSYVGYVTQTAAAEGRQVNFALLPDAIGLEQIVVTGTRTPKLLKDAPIVTRVITADDIKKIDATHIGDLLQQELPGLEFSYAMNQQVTLNMQGFGGTTVLFLVDGERLAGETMDNVDYNRLNLDNVGRIEIVKGAASSLYGSNAMGGVVNLISKESEEKWTANINAHLGQHDEQRYGATGTFNIGKVYSVTNFQYTTVDQIDLENDGDFTTVYGSKTYNIKERIVLKVNDDLRFTARAGYFFRQRNYSDDEKNRYRDYSAGLRGNYHVNDANDVEVAYSFDQYDKSDYYPSTGYDIRDYSNVQNSIRALYNHTFAGNNILTVGSDFMHDYLLSYQFEDNGSKDQNTADVFAQFDWNPLDKLNVIAGARFDYYSEADVKHVSPKLGLMYKLNRVSLRGSYSGGFRAPTLKETYMSYDMASIFMIYGNEDLEPETSHNFQLSAEYTRRIFNANVSGYYNFVDNRITTIWNQELYGMLYSNIQDMQIYGVEANASLRLDCGFGARASYVYTHEHMQKGETYQSYTSSARPHTATMRVEYGRRYGDHSFNVSLSGRVLSAVDTFEYSAYVQDETGEVPTEDAHYPGYSLWKFMFTQTFHGGVTLTAAVDNLLDYVPSYYYNNSPTTTGRTFSVSASIDIQELIKK